MNDDERTEDPLDTIPLWMGVLGFGLILAACGLVIYIVARVPPAGGQ